jgi:phosphatidate phosphatase APP1
MANPFDAASKPASLPRVQQTDTKSPATGAAPTTAASQVAEAKPYQATGAAKNARPATADETPLTPAQQKATDLANSMRLYVGSDGQRAMGPGDCVNITAVLTKATPDELDALFRAGARKDPQGAAPVATLINRMAATSPDWSGDLVKKLSQRKDLTPNTSANLIGAIARSGDTSKASQQAIADLFQNLHGADLVAVKNGIDATGDQTGMMSVVFGAVDDAGIRSQILDHFKAEAKTMPELPAKVLSDVDDTFKQGWVDQSVPKGAVNPGVLSFYQALEQGPHDLPTQPTDLGFLTARPAILEPLTQHTLSKDGVPEHEVLLENSPLRFAGNSNIATGKDHNFDKYQQLYPERRMPFIGDSGQGDPLTGAHILQGNSKGAVYIHDVCVDGAPKTSQADRDTKRGQGLNYFDTYAGAASMAFQNGVISTNGLVSVGQSTIDDAKAMKFDDDAQRSRYFAWLKRDVDTINGQLASAGDPRRLSLQ